MILKTEYTFDDILIVPKESDIKSISSEVSVHSRVGQYLLELPIISAAMTTVTGVKMQEAMLDAGGLGIHHRYVTGRRTLTTEDIPEFVRRAMYGPVAVSPSADKTFTTGLIQELVLNGFNREQIIFAIDVAHGHRYEVLEFARFLKKQGVTVWSGNIVTRDAANAYADILDSQTDALKVGIGPGAACTTRVVTGCGRPQATALWEIYNELKLRTSNLSIISDGGIKSSGDIVKAFALGADAVILGKLLAGTAETPSETRIVDGKPVQIFSGMASESVLAEAGKTVRAEGISMNVEFVGSVHSVLKELKDGIQAGLGYTGSRNISELRNRAHFVRQTSAGITEGNPRI